MTWSQFLPTFGALFVIVMLRANATYWLGRGAAAGGRRWRKSEGEGSPAWQRARALVNRWGPIAVVLCFFTVGIQTAVNATAGVTRMPLRRYLPAVTVGCIIWAFMYGTVGFIGWYAVVRLWERSPALTVAVLAAGAAVVVWVVTRRDRAEAVPAAE